MLRCVHYNAGDYIFSVFEVICNITLFKRLIKEKDPRAYLFHTNPGVRETNAINLSCSLQNCFFSETQQKPLHSF